ncbi:murein hydrolase activator EnvC family protein [Salsuginibacillus kocurii]|uniref:murein hydrolase activator EnvC family protein n=1 Tax=Salsuginibacillus kocurii TaxID=427078 RepID=UPI00036748AC|nr:M23 family metallopeptidase [Salsuginibacillus kocurii]
MMQRVTLSLLGITLIGSGIMQGLSANGVQAETDLEEELREIQEDREHKEDEAERTEEEIEAVEEAMNELEEEMREADEEIAETTAEIREHEEEIEETRDNIERLEAEIEEIEGRIEERDELLRDRVRSMYQNGGDIEYLEVLLGAQSFGDFLDRVSALSAIAEQDQSIIEEHEKDHEMLEDRKQRVEEELETLEGYLAELETLMDTLEEQREDKDELMGDLEEEESALVKTLGDTENEAEILERQEEAKEAEIEAYDEEQRELERQEAEEPSTDSASSSDAPSASSGGELMMPATGRHSSGFGERWGDMHYGLDIAQGDRSNVPVVAAEAGTVIEARYMNGYGNTVLITHNVNGETLTTLYAHLDSKDVSSGDRVERGEEIGIMGNTGFSTGPHLHFEVHEGGWNQAKSNAVDPVKYLE